MTNLILSKIEKRLKNVESKISKIKDVKFNCLMSVIISDF